MPTSVRAVTTSIAPPSASPVGGLRSSVSTSIKSSPIRMISIGPEGGRARIDTSFSPNPFTRMRPANPNANPGGKIFGENGASKPHTAESVFGPKMGEIRFNRPTPRVSYTPETTAKVDMGSAFAKARARNQSQVAVRKVETSKVSDLKIPDQRINQSINQLAKSIDFKGFQSIPQVKEPAQISGEIARFPNFPDIPNSETITRPTPRIPLSEINTAGVRNALNSREVLKEMPESVRFAQILRDWRYLPTEAISTNRLVRTIGAAEESRRANDRMQIRLKTAKTEHVVQSNLTERPQPLPKLTIENVHSFTALQPLVDQKIMTEDQAMQAAGVIRANRFETPKAISEAPKTTLPKVDGITQKQAEVLVAMAPLIREGTEAAKAQIFATTGVNQKVAQQFIQRLGQARPSIEPVEQTSQTREQVALQKAVQLVRLPELGGATADESETEIKKKAQALIAVIRQTHQFSALGNSEADTALLVERQLAASEAVPERLRSRVSSLLVQMVREVITNPPEDPSQKALHQVDLEKQNKRVKLASKSIDEAPRNDQGEIARDFVIGQIQENNNQNYWGRLAIVLKQNFDGSLDEMVVRLKKLKFWESAQTVAKTIDDSMAEYPAVEPAFKQTTKEVGRKEVGKTMDPMWAEMIKSLIKTLVITPKTI